MARHAPGLPLFSHALSMLFFVFGLLIAAQVKAQAPSPNSSATDKQPATLRLAGPAAGVSNALIHLANHPEDYGLSQAVEFTLWNTPDQLRALILSDQADFIALPTNVTANLYNRGAPLQLLNVSQWGVLWVISRDAYKSTLNDFIGEEIGVPFRGDMPDIVLTHLITEAGLDPKKDFRLHYLATPMEAMQMLIMRRLDHALLAEPAVSMALRKTHSFPLSAIAPELHRSVDLQQEWGRLMHTEARIPQAGIAAVGALRHQPAVLEQFSQAYEAANRWCYQHAQDCALEVAQAVPMLDAAAVQDSLDRQNTYFATAQEAAPELKRFYQILLDHQPATIGGKLPEEQFYHQEQP